MIVNQNKRMKLNKFPCFDGIPSIFMAESIVKHKSVSKSQHGFIKGRPRVF